MESIVISADIIMPFIQITVAMFLGILLGLERTFAGKTAGMRTYGLVSMGSCLFVIVAHAVNQSYIQAGLVDFDPLRMSAAVVTGIGFIGAGLIIFKESKLSGLTTAAGLWVACGIGIAVGFQLFAIASFVALLTLFNFTVMWLIEYRMAKFIDKKNEVINRYL